jgi:hypothetical protein
MKPLFCILIATLWISPLSAQDSTRTTAALGIHSGDGAVP